jgi:hypothetical protein
MFVLIIGNVILILALASVIRARRRSGP